MPKTGPIVGESPRALKSAYAETPKSPEIPMRYQDGFLFAEALKYQMAAHGDDDTSLCKALKTERADVGKDTLRSWRIGRHAPVKPASFRALSYIESRYGLPTGYFESKIT